MPRAKKQPRKPRKELGSKSILDYVPRGYTLREGQRHTLLQIEENWNKADVFLIDAPVACHAEGQKVLMFDGTLRKVEDVQVGDLLMGPDSTPRKVQVRHEGTAPLFDVIPKRGPTWRVTGEHVLVTKHYNKNRKRTIGAVWEELEIKAKDYVTKSRDFKNNTWQISSAVDYPEKQLPMDPYIFGMWLGDGTSSHLSLTTMDQELSDAWVSFLEGRGYGVRITRKSGPKNKAWEIHSNRGSAAAAPVEELRALGVWKNKHIPLDYLTGSMKQRLALWAGLMDTDGSVSQERRSFEITTKLHNLSLQYAQLARSIGLSVTSDVKIINGTPYYRIRGSSGNMENPEIIPVKLIRKRLPKATNNQANCKFDVIPAGEGRYVGFTVDNDHRYLLDTHVVTHNSGKSLISVTISSWLYGALGLKSTIAVPNNLLLNQYTEEFPLTTLKAQSKYTCMDYVDSKQPLSCKKVKQYSEFGTFCDSRRCCYLQAVRKANATPTGVYNYHTLLAYRMFRDVILYDECIPGRSFVKTEEKQMTANVLFKKWENGEEVNLACVDESGNLVYRPMTYAWKRPQGTKRLLRIETTATQFECTDNHLVRLLSGEYVAAGTLVGGEKLSYISDSKRSAGRLVPKIGARDVLIGSILGDGYWRQDPHVHNGKRLNIRHGAKQLDYLKWKSDILGVEAKANGKSGFTGEVQYVCNTSYLDDTLVDKSAAIAALTPESLAIWFCDDGSRNKTGNQSTFHTESWKEHEINKAKEKLREFGLEFIKQKVRKSNGREYITLRATKDSTQKLLELIAPHVPECMSYKVYPFIAKGQHRDSGYEDIQSHTVISVSEQDAVDFVYDFEVKDHHNFLIKRVQGSSGWTVVHNCHNLVSFLRDAAGKKIWRHEYHYPENVRTYGQLYSWVVTELEVKPGDKKLSLLKEELETGENQFLVERTREDFRGEERDVIKLSPLDVSNHPPILWPEKKVKKLILLSATMNLRDLMDLGLDKRRVMTINTKSPIPKERRPLVYVRDFNLSYKNQETNLPLVAEWISKFLDENPERGFIHAPYGLAWKLRQHLNHPRFIFHDTKSRQSAFDTYRETEGAVLVASGMAEGVSLNDDLGRWQIILKVPWPSLAEPAIKWKAENDPDFYLNATVKEISQAYGRVCRGEKDWGKTILLDNSFDFLKRRGDKFFPPWLKEAIVEDFNNDEWRKLVDV